MRVTVPKKNGQQMTPTNRQRLGEWVHWTGRLWSLPLITATFLLAAGPFLPLTLHPGRAFLLLSSPFAMALAIALVLAWRWEATGGWIALALGVVLLGWATFRSGHLALPPFVVLFWGPAILFLLSWSLHRPVGSQQLTEPGRDGASASRPKRQGFLAMPSSRLGWWALVIGTGFFLFMRLFWMQANNPGRDRSTFFSDPVNAGCLIGAFGSSIAGMVMAWVAIIWKRERSLLLVPLLLLGVFTLLWAIALMSGANA
jgi:hypothetical protein